MRLAWEILTLVLCVAVLLVLARGFPQFGRVLFFLIANPLGILVTLGIATWVLLARNRSSRHRESDSR